MPAQAMLNFLLPVHVQCPAFVRTGELFAEQGSENKQSHESLLLSSFIWNHAVGVMREAP